MNQPKSLGILCFCAFLALSSAAFAQSSPEQALRQVSTPEEACNLSYLESLGWAVVPGAAGTGAQVVEGNPCDNTSVAESQAQGELRITIASDADASQITQVAKRLTSLTQSTASMCAYKFKVAQAVQASTNQLAVNERWRFTGRTQVKFISFGFFGAGRAGWKQRSSLGTSYWPKKSNSKAVSSFYRKKIKNECAVGLQIAEYATQLELFGEQGFDTAFGRNEIVIGTWNQINASESATRGTHLGRALEDRYAERTSQLGAMALVGVSGYIGNVLGEKYLDNSADRGENYIISAVTPQAGEALKRAGGFAYYNQQNRRLYELNSRLDRQYLNTVLSASTPDVDAQSLQIINEMRSILSDPVYTGITVFVHPLDYMTFGQHIVRLLGVNPRTPYEFTLYTNNVNYGLMDRYVSYQVNSCLGR